MSNYNGYMSHYSTNSSSIFNNPGFTKELSALVRQKLGRKLTKSEGQRAVNIYQSVDKERFNGRKEDYILGILSSTIVDDIRKNPCKNEDEINIQETLKGIMGLKTQEGNTTGITDEQLANQINSSIITQVDISSFLGNNNIRELQKIFSPGLVKTTVSIILDTRNRALENDGTKFFQWNFVNNEITAQGTVNAIGNIRDIIRMRISQIRIPWNATADNDYKRLTLYIKEFSAQSFIAPEGTRFHWIFNTRIDGNYIELRTDGFNDGFFRFRTPVVSLDTLTISFGSPLEPIVFDTDRSYAVINGTGFGTNTTITTNTPHNLQTGDRVYISGFTTANPNTDNAVIGLINQQYGQKVIVTGANTFTITVNSTSIFQLGIGTVSVINGSTTVTGNTNVPAVLSTTFTTTFATVLKIIIVTNLGNTQYTINSVTNNQTLVLSSSYTGISASGLQYYYFAASLGSGTLNVTNGSTTVIGVGTNFTTTFSPNDTIGIGIGVGQVLYTVFQVADDQTIILTTNYAGITTTGLQYDFFVPTLGPGTLTVTNSSTTVTGTTYVPAIAGTNFSSLFYANDVIGIGIGTNEVTYPIQTVVNDNTIILKQPYTGTTASGLGYYRDNRTSGFVMTVYFASKRIFIPIELEYYNSGADA